MNLFMTVLVVSDYAASLRWYRDTIGLPVELASEATGFALLCGSEGGRLALKRGTPVPGGVKLNFEVADLYTELARLAALGLGPDGPVQVSDEGYRRAVFRDPDGYSVVLFEWVKLGGHPA